MENKNNAELINFRTKAFQFANNGLLIIIENNIVDYNQKLKEILEIDLKQSLNFDNFLAIFSDSDFKSVSKFINNNEINSNLIEEYLINTFENNKCFIEILITKFKEKDSIVNLIEIKNINQRKNADIDLLEARESSKLHNTP